MASAKVSITNRVGEYFIIYQMLELGYFLAVVATLLGITITLSM